jgi:hypothetical protein
MAIEPIEAQVQNLEATEGGKQTIWREDPRENCEKD